MSNALKITTRLNKMLVNFNDNPVVFITKDMFNSQDIKNIERCKNNPSLIFVTFYGINGLVPLRFFDSEAQDKIRNYLKVRQSKLWETLNESCN